MTTLEVTPILPDVLNFASTENKENRGLKRKRKQHTEKKPGSGSASGLLKGFRHSACHSFTGF